MTKILRAAATDVAQTDTYSLSNEDSRAWIRSFGTRADTDNTGNTAQLDHRTAGILAGAEHRGENFTAGLALGSSRTSLNQDARASEAQSDNYHVMAYGSRDLTEKMKVTGGASFTWHEIETDRRIDLNGLNDRSKGDYSARSTQFFAEVSRDYQPVKDNEKLTLTPYLQGAYVIHKNDKFREDGAAGLTADQDTTDLATTTLGMLYSQDLKILDDRIVTVHAGAAWQHSFGDVDPKKDLSFNDVPDSTYTIKGAPIDKNAALLSAGVSFKINQTLSFGVSYDGSYGADRSEQGIAGHLSLKF